ncbi:hypothetical protein E2C01_045694 [Portunus trituberculatus]|uniref:Transmembrane protein n=1 Tax=Portunus trituberculatus TaxID=210409 RepID=A0A5B7FWG6_PORTR|nr:hypothetical protein [Portunus trituberculatus]
MMVFEVREEEERNCHKQTVSLRGRSNWSWGGAGKAAVDRAVWAGWQRCGGRLVLKMDINALFFSILIYFYVFDGN